MKSSSKKVTEADIVNASLAFGDFVAYSQDRAFIYGIMKDEDFQEFCKEHYDLGVDSENNIYVLSRKKDGKQLVKYHLSGGLDENGELKANMIIIKEDEKDD